MHVLGSCIAVPLLFQATFASPAPQIDERPASAPVCGSVGYGKARHPLSTSQGTIAQCSELCKKNTNCQSYGYGQNVCRLYSTSVKENLKPGAGSPYKFYDKACPSPGVTSTQQKTTTTSTSTSKTSTTKTSTTKRAPRHSSTSQTSSSSRLSSSLTLTTSSSSAQSTNTSAQTGSSSSSSSETTQSTSQSTSAAPTSTTESSTSESTTSMSTTSEATASSTTESSTTSSSSSSTSESTTSTSSSANPTRTPLPCTPGRKCSPGGYLYMLYCESRGISANEAYSFSTTSPEECVARWDSDPSSFLWNFDENTQMCTIGYGDSFTWIPDPFSQFGEYIPTGC